MSEQDQPPRFGPKLCRLCGKDHPRGECPAPQVVHTTISLQTSEIRSELTESLTPMIDALSMENRAPHLIALDRIADAHEKAYGVKIGAETAYNIIQELKAAHAGAPKPVCFACGEGLTPFCLTCNPELLATAEASASLKIDGLLNALQARAEAAEAQRDALLVTLEPFARAFSRFPRDMGDKSDLRAWFVILCTALAPADFRRAKQARDACTGGA